MKLTYLLIAVLAIFTAACNEAKTSSETKTETKATIPYPLDTCLVSGEKLGSMGKPPVIIHEGQEIKFCCKSCIPDFKKDPAKYLSKLNEKTDEASPADPSTH